MQYKDMRIISKRMDEYLGWFAREYIYLSLDTQRFNFTKTESGLKNDDYFEYYHDIKNSLMAGKIAVRPHLKNELLKNKHTAAAINANDTDEVINVAVVKSLDGQRLYQFVGHHAEQVMNHFNVSYGNIKCTFAYLKASYHTYLAKFDKHTGEAKYIGWNPHEYKGIWSYLYLRNEETYHQMYHPKANRYEPTQIDNYAALTVAFDGTENQCAAFDRLLQQKSKIISGYYNVITNNCDMNAFEFLKKIGRIGQDDHPQHFHEIDKMSFLDVGNLHNMFVSLPLIKTLCSPKFLYYSAISVARFVGFTLENWLPSFLLPYSMLPNDLTYNDKILTGDSGFLLALKKLQLEESLRQYKPEHANQIDAVGKLPVHYVFCKPNSAAKTDLIHHLLRDTSRENLNKIDEEGYETPLMAAAQCGTVQEMEDLLKAGASPSLTSREGKNVAQYIIDKNAKDLTNKIIFLLENAAEIATHRDIKFNQTVFERAGCENENIEECIATIREKGINYKWPEYHNPYHSHDTTSANAEDNIECQINHDATYVDASVF